VLKGEGQKARGGRAARQEKRRKKGRMGGRQRTAEPSWCWGEGPDGGAPHGGKGFIYAGT